MLSKLFLWKHDSEKDRLCLAMGLTHVAHSTSDLPSLRLLQTLVATLILAIIDYIKCSISHPKHLKLTNAWQESKMDKKYIWWLGRFV